MRILALVFLTATPVLADPACVAAPTQDCVFTMAVDQAQANPKAGVVATGLMVTAVWQESTGRDDWSATLDLLEPSVARAEPDPEKAHRDLAFALFGVAISSHYGDMPPLVAAPRVTTRLVALEEELAARKSDQADPAKAEHRVLRRLGQAHDLSAIVARIEVADVADKPDLVLAAAAGLLQGHNVEDAFSLLQLAPSRDLARDIGRLAVDYTLRTDGADAAASLAVRLADRQDRAEALVTVALRMAELGRLPQALSIARHPMVTEPGFPDVFSLVRLAEIHARAGDRPRALALLDQAQGAFGSDRVRVIAATVAGDFAPVFPLLDKAETSSRYLMLRGAVQSRWHATGQDGTEAFLTLLPKADLPVALVALGQAQIDSGDLPAALATDARLAALPEAETRLVDLRRDLAPFLAEQGRIAEAVAMADALGHPWATAHVAAAMELPGEGANP